MQSGLICFSTTNNYLMLSKITPKIGNLSRNKFELCNRQDLNFWFKYILIDEATIWYNVFKVFLIIIWDKVKMSLTSNKPFSTWLMPMFHFIYLKLVNIVNTHWGCLSFTFMSDVILRNGLQNSDNCTNQFIFTCIGSHSFIFIF